MIEPIDQKDAIGKRVSCILGEIGLTDRVVVVFDDGTYFGLMSNNEQWHDEHHGLCAYKLDITDFSKEDMIRWNCNFITITEIVQAEFEKKTAEVARQRERDFADLARLKQRLGIA